MVRKYNAESIDAPTPMEHVRANPGMYVGDIDTNGTQQCFKEVMQNATDEMRENGGGHILVRIQDDIVTVADQGRGIPVERHSKTGVSTLETVLTYVGAGGKSGTGKSAYGERTIGVHGVGVSAVCALSDKMSVWTFRRDCWWRIDLACGKVVSKLSKDKAPFKWPRGTIVRYHIDTSVLPEPLVLSNVRHYCQIVRHFDPVEIDYADDERSAILEARQPAQMLTSSLAGSETLLGPFDFNGRGVRAVMAWVNEADFSIKAHVAGAPVPSGTHVAGLEDAIKEAFAKAKPRDSKNVDPMVGLRAIIDVSVDRPSFSGQSKTALRTSSVRGQVSQALTVPLTRELRDNGEAVLAMLEHAARITKIDTKHKADRELAKVVASPRGVLAFPKGFMAALSVPPDRRETYIVEGDSAAGSAKDAKLPHQEILPLYGKMANVIVKAGAVKTNERVGGILRVLGYDPNKPDHAFRTGKVILLADADDDGDHITVLLLTVFQEVVPRIIREGRLYIVDAPLFEAMTLDGTRVMGSNLANMSREYGKLTRVNRMKGWGGAPVPLLRQFAFDPASRKLLRIGVPSESDADGLTNLMGLDASTRKELLDMGEEGSK